MYCRPIAIGLKTSIRFVVLYATKAIVINIMYNCLELVEIPCSEKLTVIKTWNFWITFFKVFLEMPLMGRYVGRVDHGQPKILVVWATTCDRSSH